MRIHKPNLLTGKPFPGEKHPGLELDICFYELEDDDKYDSEDKL